MFELPKKYKFIEFNRERNILQSSASTSKVHSHVARSYQSETTDDREKESNKLELENTLNLPIIIFSIIPLCLFFCESILFCIWISNVYLNINLVLFSFIKLELKTLIWNYCSIIINLSESSSIIPTLYWDLKIIWIGDMMKLGDCWHTAHAQNQISERKTWSGARAQLPNSENFWNHMKRKTQSA